MSGDPPLSAEGEKQAKDLGIQLHHQKITHLYSSQYLRSQYTAAPISQAIGVPIETYTAGQEKNLLTQLTSIKKENVLVVGHSNTVDDLVNGLTGQQLLTDRPETEYGIIYLVKRKNNRYTFEQVPLERRTPR